MFRFDFSELLSTNQLLLRKRKSPIFVFSCHYEGLMLCSNQRNLVTLIKSHIKSKQILNFVSEINFWVSEKYFRDKYLGKYRKLIENSGCESDRYQKEEFTLCSPLWSLKIQNRCSSSKERYVSAQSPYFKYDFVQKLVHTYVFCFNL